MNGPKERNDLLTNLTPFRNAEETGEDLSNADVAALEAALVRALRPVSAPAGFTEGVLRRLDREGPPAVSAHYRSLGKVDRPFGKLLTWPTARLQGWGAAALAAAALALAIFTGQESHTKHVQERELAERRAAATQQFEASVRIMDRTMEETRERLRKVGVTGVE